MRKSTFLRANEKIMSNTPSATESNEPIITAVRRSARYWPALTIVFGYWAITIGMGRTKMPYFFRFLLGMVVPFFSLSSLASSGSGERMKNLGHAREVLWAVVALKF